MDQPLEGYKEKGHPFMEDPWTFNTILLFLLHHRSELIPVHPIWTNLRCLGLWF